MATPLPILGATIDADGAATSGRAGRSMGDATLADATHVLLSSVQKSYGEIEAIRDASFALTAGEFVSVLGPSGCGKSTLLMMIAGLISPSAGKITAVPRPSGSLSSRDGAIVTPCPMAASRRAAFGYLAASSTPRSAVSGTGARRARGPPMHYLDEPPTAPLSGGQDWTPIDTRAGSPPCGLAPMPVEKAFCASDEATSALVRSPASCTSDSC